VTVPGSVPTPAPVDLARMRQSYAGTGLSESDLAPDWLTQFNTWLAQATVAELPEPNAMVVATVSPEGAPSTRTVLAKGVDVQGVVFYTNYESAKSAELDTNPQISATFPWYALRRQVHLRGVAERVDAATTEAYWATRPRASQLGAWASPQSQVLGSFPAGTSVEDFRHLLDERQAEVERRFGGGPDAVDAPPVPVPPQWGGWRIVPSVVEFWQGRTGRLHDRLRYRRAGEGWVVERLAP
jgi:pyridoxamine 5'-phosphate oxidase